MANINYAPATDRKGNVLIPGDRVRFKTYPKGKAEGIVTISPRTYVVQPDGSVAPALIIVTDDGVDYPLLSSGVLKLS